MRIHVLFLLMVIGLSLSLLAPSHAQPVSPTVTVTIHRIQIVDPIEGFLEGQADWFYHIGYRPAGVSTYTWIGPVFAPAESDDVVVDDVHSFEILADTVEVVIELCEDDIATADDFADVSSDIGEGVDNVDCITRPSPGNWYAASFHTTYDLVTGSMTGDTVTQELGWWKTSGEFDGSTGGDTNDANVFLDISDNYGLPTADAGSDRSGFTGDTFSFDATGSLASAGSSIESYTWDFTGDLTPDLSGSIVSWTFNAKGTHVVTLLVVDSVGNTDSDTSLVTIQNRAPTAAFAYGPSNPTVKDDITFADTSVDPDGTIASWTWEFGDGSTSTLPSPTHRYSANGPKTVSLTVTDNDGASASVSQTVDVANLNPTASFTFSPSVVTTADIVQFTDTSTDEDGTVLARTWDFGDGSSSGEQNPTHNYGSPGEYEVRLTVTDNDGGAHFAIQSVSVAQGLPGGTVLGIPVLLLVGGPAAGVAIAAIILVLRWRKKAHGES